MELFEIKSEKLQNRLYIVLKGFFLESELDLAYDKLLRELRHMKFGMDVIIDISKMQTKPEYIKDIFYERLLMRVKPDSRYICRVTQNNKILESLKNISKSGPESHVRVKYINSVNEADIFLEQICLMNNIYNN
ncbi:MAG: hypothetical protein R6W78_15590 [Bacteroidales bacterium]